MIWLQRQDFLVSRRPPSCGISTKARLIKTSNMSSATFFGAPSCEERTRGIKQRTSETLKA